MNDGWVNPNYHRQLVDRLVATARALREELFIKNKHDIEMCKCRTCGVMRDALWVYAPMPTEICSTKQEE